MHGHIKIRELRMWIKSLFVGFLLMANASYAKQPELAEISLSENVLTFIGPIFHGDLDRILTLVKASEYQVALFKVDSGGGSIDEALSIGTWINKNSIDVEIMGTCASSCANYIFTAGATKYLNKDSFMLWHGGMQQPGFKESYEQGNALDTWQYLYDKEQTFFNQIGVKSWVTVCGQYSDHNNSLFDEKKELTFYGIFQLLMGKLSVGYDYSIEDMKKFGINNIKLREGKWNWREYKELESNRKVIRYAVTELDNDKVQCSLGSD